MVSVRACKKGTPREVGACARGGWITCRNRNGSAQNHFGLVFVIASAAAMDGRRSCPCEQLPAQKDWEEQTARWGRVWGGAGQGGVNHTWPVRGCAIFQL